MNGAQHYIEAELLLEGAAGETHEEAHEDRLTAQVHATLALAAAVAESVLLPDGRALVRRPPPADGPDPAYPGNDWGRAIHGPLPTSDDKEN